MRVQCALAEWFSEDNAWRNRSVRRDVVNRDPPTQWAPPMPGTIKMNVDASWEKNEKAAFAFIGWDWKGSMDFGQAGLFRCFSAAEAEAYAIRNACLYVNQIQQSCIIIESDAQDVLKAISAPVTALCWRASAIVEDIKKIVAEDPRVSFQCIRRTVNQPCDWIAKCRRKEELPINWSSSIHPQLLYLLSHDIHLTGVG